MQRRSAPKFLFGDIERKHRHLLEPVQPPQSEQTESQVTWENYKAFLQPLQPEQITTQLPEPQHNSEPSSLVSATDPGFIQGMEELRQVFQPVLEQATGEPELAETGRLLPGSIEWNRAEFVLNFAHATLEKKQKASAENSSYRLDRTELEITVTRKADGQIIAQGKLGKVGWDISAAKVDLDDWLKFLKHQQKDTTQEQNPPTSRSRTQSSRQQSRDDGLSL